jgi:hypothetical protein
VLVAAQLQNEAQAKSPGTKLWLYVETALASEDQASAKMRFALKRFEAL